MYLLRTGTSQSPATEVLGTDDDIQSPEIRLSLFLLIDPKMEVKKRGGGIGKANKV